MILKTIPTARALANEPPLLAATRAGEWLGYSKPGTYQAIADGTFPIPVHQVGARKVSKLADLLDFYGIPIAAVLAAQED